MPSAWTPLANLTLGSAASSVTFSSISGSYRDLVLVVAGGSNSYSSFQVQLNSNTSGYTLTLMEANGSSAYGGSSSSSGFEGNYNIWVEDIGTSNTVYEFHLFDYAQTDKHKTALYKVRAAATGVASYAGRWANTSAVTSLVATRVGGNSWRSGTTFALYGVSA